MDFFGANVTVGASYPDPVNSRNVVVAYLQYFNPYQASGEVKALGGGKAFHLTFTGKGQAGLTETYNGYGYSVTVIPLTKKLVETVRKMSQKNSKKFEALDSNLRTNRRLLFYTARTDGYTMHVYQSLTNDDSGYATVIVSHGSCVWKKIYPRASFVHSDFFKYKAKQYFTVILYAHGAGLFPIVNTFEIPSCWQQCKNCLPSK